MEIERLTISPLYTLKEAQCTTVGKSARKTENVNREFAAVMAMRKKKSMYVPDDWLPDDEDKALQDFEEIKQFYIKQFICRHSTIESISFSVKDTVRNDVINQVTRATKIHPRYYVQSKRPDWNNGEPRKPSDQTYSKFMSIWNPLSWMLMCNQRLCYKAMKETREWVFQAVEEMANSDEPMLQALAVCSVPQCIQNYGCTELKGCGWFSEVVKAEPKDTVSDIKKRFEWYHNATIRPL